jgi:cytosine/adenosine deaminase-related metal-dependent hydrolase/ubiquinone/menaquinone biosynthesis C-methylase UbiE
MSSLSEKTSESLDQEAENLRAFDTISGSYDTDINPLLALEERYLRPMLPPVTGIDVLDAGCGSGRWSRELAAARPRRLTGIDASAQMLEVARTKQIPRVELIRCGLEALPLADQSLDLILSSFVMSYIEDLACLAREFDRVARKGCSLLVSDMHPETQRQLGWKRTFSHGADKIEVTPFSHDLNQIVLAFQDLGWHLDAAIEPVFGASEKSLFETAGRMENFLQAEGHPAIYILHLRKTDRAGADHRSARQLILRSARCALGAAECVGASLHIADGKVAEILSHPLMPSDSAARGIDLSGYIVMPGLINPHDHLEFALFTRLGNPPYDNASAWALDIQETFKNLISRHRSVPKEVRLWWGGIRNLLCGVTTVCHHNEPDPELFREDFPVRVVQDIGWAHSLAFGGDLPAVRAAAPADRPFIVHACEGIDGGAISEVSELERLGILDEDCVLVHGLALDLDGLGLVERRGASVIVCPSSNDYLFGRVPDLLRFQRLRYLALGSDSPLTGIGDLLDEIRFAIRYCNCSPELAYQMVTSAPAAMLRLRDDAGSIRVSGRADLIAVRDPGSHAAQCLPHLSSKDVELVIIGGRIQLASRSMLARIPKAIAEELEPLWIDGTMRWLRAPVPRLIEEAEKSLGIGTLDLSGKPIRLPRSEELRNAD